MTSPDPSRTGEEDPALAARERRAALFVVFATILIDFAGFTILIPVLPGYADRLGASAFQVGLLLTIYALAQLLFLPAWGWLSDRFGRRPIVLVSLAGTALAYGLLAVSTSLEGLYLARGLAGFFAGVIGAAQAVVTDVTSPNERARGMGRIGAAIGLGLVVGPAVGGLLGAVDERAPFVAVAAVSALNLLIAFFILPETRPDRDEPVRWADFMRSLVPAPLRLAGAVHDRRLGLYLYLFFHVALAFSVLEALLPIYLGARFGSETLEIGLLFSTIGVFMILTQGVLIGRLADRYRESALVTTGLSACALALAAIAWVPSMNGLFWISPLVGLGYGMAYPTFMSLFSQACEAREAGELLGQSQSMATTGRVVGPIWAGLVMDHVAPALTFIVAGALLLAAMAIFGAYRKLLTGERG